MGQEGLSREDRAGEATAHLEQARAITFSDVSNDSAGGLRKQKYQPACLWLLGNQAHNAIEAETVQDHTSESELLADRRIDLALRGQN